MNDSSQIKLDFALIGAMKCGTTSLAGVLADHKQISFSSPKETMFFSHVEDWEQKLDTYHKKFKKRPNVIYGEGSTTYSYDPKQEVHKKLYSYNPNLKILYIVRNPVDRIISHYKHNFERGYKLLPFKEEVVSNDSYFRLSRYVYQIAPYLELFGSSNVMLLDFDDFIHSRELVMKKVAHFLGIREDQFLNFQGVELNSSKKEAKVSHKYDKYVKILKPVLNQIPKGFRTRIKLLLAKLEGRRMAATPIISDENKAWIAEEFKQDIADLEKLMDKDLSKWRV